jgi:hypothetical protein
MAADMPGMPYFVRSRARRSSRARRRRGVALGLPTLRGDGTPLAVFGGAFGDGAGLGEDGAGLGPWGAGVVEAEAADDGAGDAGTSGVAAAGVPLAAGTPGVAEVETASGPVDPSKRGDISQPLTATPSTTSATRNRRAAWFTRVEGAACRPHHSASR